MSLQSADTEQKAPPDTTSNTQPNQIKTFKYRTTRPIIPPEACQEPFTITIADKKRSTLSAPPSSKNDAQDHNNQANSLRIQFRPYASHDLQNFHRLRTQENVMMWTSKGRVDKDLDETRAWMARFIPSDTDVEGKESSEKTETTVRKSLNFSLFARELRSGNDRGTVESVDNDEAWEHIGVAGSHIFTPVANVGYMLREEWWGRGIATAVMKAFLDLWWKFERKIVEFEHADILETEGVDVNADGSKIDEKDDSWKYEYEEVIAPKVEVAKPVQKLQSAEKEVVEQIIEQQSSDRTSYQALDSEAKDGMKEQRPKVEDMITVPEILFAEIEEINYGSQKVIERCGFTYRATKMVDDARDSTQKVGLRIYTLTRQESGN